MCTKKYLNTFLRREFLLLKNLKSMLFIPLILINAVLPVIALYSYKTYDINKAEYILTSLTTIIAPLTSVWWTVFILKIFIETKGNEIFFVRKKNIFAEIFFPFFIFQANTILTIYVLSRTCSCMKDLIWIMPIVSFFLFGLAYFTSFLSGSITITILINIVYILVNQIVITVKPQPFIFTSVIGVADESVKTALIPIAISGIILTVLGYFFNNRFKIFK